MNPHRAKTRWPAGILGKITALNRIGRNDATLAAYSESWIKTPDLPL